jgi:hypothetical protein
MREFWIVPTVNTTQILMGFGLRPWVLVIPPFTHIVIQLAQNGVLGLGYLGFRSLEGALG